jgi:hypothetical protein
MKKATLMQVKSMLLYYVVSTFKRSFFRYHLSKQFKMVVK